MAAAAPPPQPAAAAQPPLPFLGDDIFVLIAAELDARMLGRLGCAAQRFSLSRLLASTSSAAIVTALLLPPLHVDPSRGHSA